MGLLYVTWSNELCSSCFDPDLWTIIFESTFAFLLLLSCSVGVFGVFEFSCGIFFNTKIRQTFSQINLRHSACLLLNIEILPEWKVHSFIPQYWTIWKMDFSSKLVDFEKIPPLIKICTVSYPSLCTSPGKFIHHYHHHHHHNYNHRCSHNHHHNNSYC